MRHVAVVVFLLLGVPGAFAADPADQTQVIGLEKQLWEAWAHSDNNALEKLWASDYQEIDGDGLRNKQLALAANVGDTITEYTLKSMKVTNPNPGVALLTYQVTSTISENGKLQPQNILTFSSLYVRRAGAWKQVFTQESVAQ